MTDEEVPLTAVDVVFVADEELVGGDEPLGQREGMEENLAALDVELSVEDLAAIEAAAPPDQVATTRPASPS
ncbi:hypothetical protein [Nonomuraea roseola]|uniref:Uncharacterized protein n=1 Tax=Nonomuraea roseola TaxID=46179 RepID=A0ABV5PSV6_9ACTN